MEVEMEWFLKFVYCLMWQPRKVTFYGSNTFLSRSSTTKNGKQYTIRVNIRIRTKWLLSNVVWWSDLWMEVSIDQKLKKNICHQLVNIFVEHLDTCQCGLWTETGPAMNELLSGYIDYVSSARILWAITDLPEFTWFLGKWERGRERAREWDSKCLFLIQFETVQSLITTDDCENLFRWRECAREWDRQTK